LKTTDRKIRKALIKLLVSTIVLAALLSLCLTDINGGLKGVLIVFIIILAFPVTLLIGIDASRVIQRERSTRKSLTILARLLGFPEAIMGTVLIGFSVAYPLFGVRELLEDLANGMPPWLPAGRLALAALGFVAGLRYMRRGLALEKHEP
jgi:hypothetical protein